MHTKELFSGWTSRSTVELVDMVKTAHRFFLKKKNLAAFKQCLKRSISNQSCRNDVIHQLRPRHALLNDCTRSTLSSCLAESFKRCWRPVNCSGINSDIQWQTVILWHDNMAWHFPMSTSPASLELHYACIYCIYIPLKQNITTETCQEM